MDKRLTRSNSDKMVGGVAAGLADYLNIDPVIVRLIFVLLTLKSGVGPMLYLILWLLMPEAEDELTEKVKIG
ncbi:MAG: PspC domain-containing protein [Anaerolineales bacterium]|nr:PspC domain-containing protein [Anaerolineales bacterium]